MPEVAELTALTAFADAFAPPPPASLDDATPNAAQSAMAEAIRRISAQAALYAGEISYRSRPELGYDGLAQRLGARTPEKLVQSLTGGSLKDSRTLVKVGTLLATPRDDGTPPAPWLVDVAAAVTTGMISVGQADAIRVGLGEPDADEAAGGVRVDDLLEAALALVRIAATLSVEDLAAAARDARAELDLDRVKDREQTFRDRRYLRTTPTGDGMTRLHGLLDPESAALIVTVLDGALAPRLGGPTFIDPVDATTAEAIIADPRTTEQLRLDVLLELLRIATDADDGTILSTRKPIVQLHVTESDLRERRGLARFDGQTEPVSIETVERLTCDTGIVPILFDQHGSVLNVGRTQRRFTRTQRTALAARDGGCRIGGCDRPPSWSEAHHITPWAEGGNTDIADGILGTAEG